MNKQERDHQNWMFQALERMGIDKGTAQKLRRISMTLSRWAEKECNGNIQRDEQTNRPYWYNTNSQTHWPICDLEKGALKRLNKIMEAFPHLVAYHQGDPRGAALYMLRKDQIGPDKSIESYYTQGIAIY